MAVLRLILFLFVILIFFSGAGTVFFLRESRSMGRSIESEIIRLNEIKTRAVARPWTYSLASLQTCDGVYLLDDPASVPPVYRSEGEKSAWKQGRRSMEILSRLEILDRFQLRETPHGRIRLVPADGKPPSGARVNNISNYRPEFRIRNRGPLRFRGSELGGLLLRMSVSEGDSFRVWWSDKKNSYDPTHGTIVSIQETGSAVGYLLRISGMPGVSPDSKIDYIFIQPSDQPANQVKIESVQVHSPQSLYGSSKYGFATEAIRGDIRPVRYFWTPGTLEYPLKVKDPSVFRFGFGHLDEEAEIRCEIFLRDGERKKIEEILLPASTPWEDRTLSLKAPVSKQAALEIVVNSEKPVRTLLNSPVVVERDSCSLPNVVIFLIDALRQDHVGLYGAGPRATPHMDRFAETGTAFSGAISQGTWTCPSIPVLMTGRFPGATGVLQTGDRLPDGYPTLAQILHRKGYRTASFVANRYASSGPGLNRGFERLHGVRYFDYEAGIEKFRPKVPGGEVVGETLKQWFELDDGRPFFLYVHLMDPHGPYYPPDSFIGSVDPGAGETPVEFNGHYDSVHVKSPTAQGRRGLYKAEVTYADHTFGRFLELLKEHGRRDNTILFLTADHGELLGEDEKVWGHNKPVSEELVRIPFIVSVPGDSIKPSVGQTLSESAGLVDVAPTILDLIEGKSDGWAFQGRSLLPLLNGQEGDGNRITFAEYQDKISVGIDEKLFIEGEEQSMSFFNRLLARLNEESLNKLRTAYRSCNRIMLKQAESKKQEVEIWPEDLERLKALGYLGE